jgi:hypothetical protein
MLTNTVIQMKKEGIKEGLSTLKYVLKDSKKFDLFTHLFVDYNQNEILEEWSNQLHANGIIDNSNLTSLSNTLSSRSSFVSSTSFNNIK